MKEHGFEKSFNTPAPPVQPHFDDERTIALARPVVPLEKIEARQRQRRHWILGGAFAIAMMLGAASALLASYLKLRNVPNSVTEVTEVTEVDTPAAAPVAVSDTVASELPVLDNGGEVETTAENTEELPAPVTPRKTKPRTTANNDSEITRPRVRDGDDENELNRIREAVLYDAWQERRARRVARRERRNRSDHHDRDLSNLDEIFEGQRRRRPRYPPY